jgi:hypothetical protein
MASVYDRLISLAGAAQIGDRKSVGEAIRLLAAVAAGGEPIAIGGAISIGPENANIFQGRTLVFSTAATVTLKVGLPANFGFAVRPPSSGNASIASDGVVTLNGATTTLTRTVASNTLFGVSAIGVNAYAVTGS